MKQFLKDVLRIWKLRNHKRGGAHQIGFEGYMLGFNKGLDNCNCNKRRR